MKKRFLSIFLTICMLLSLLPTVALAAVDPTTNLCEHHTAHDTAVCGYVEGAEGAACGYICPDCAGEAAPTSDTTDPAAQTTTYAVTVSKGGSGTITGEGSYGPGDQVTITATPDTANSYCTAGWSSANLGMNISPINRQTSYTFTMPEQNVVISVTFEQHKYISHKNNGDGTHDVHCTYCSGVQTPSESCVDVHSGGNNVTPDGYCDKCSTEMTYTISFNANGGSGDMNSVKYAYSSSGYTLPANGFTAPEGKAFAGWATSADGSVINGSTYSIMKDTILYAIWEDHTHSYASGWLNDASDHWRGCSCGEIGDKAAHSGPAATATTPQTCTVCGYVMTPATGYTLTLNYSEDSTGVSVDPGSKTVTGIAPGTVVDLSAHWPANKTVTVGETTYYFAGFEQNKGDTKVESPTVTVNSDLTLNANWTTTQMVTITFDTKGGTMPYVTTRVKMTTLVDSMNSIHKPIRSGYDFVGWSLENDGTADSGDSKITADCTLYAVWQQYSPSYDVDYYDPPPSSIPIDVGGECDAILRDNVVIVRGDDHISGTLDLGKTDAVAIRLPADAVKASTGEGNAVTIKYPGGTSALITGSGLAAAEDALRSGESLQIAVTQVDAGALPENLTAPPDDDGPFGGSGTELSGAYFFGAGISEERLIELGVMDGSTDQTISEDEFEYLYHYLTTEDLTVIRAMLEADQRASAWLDEMIERDAVTPLGMQALLIMADLTGEQVMFLADMELNDPTIGQIRQAGLTLEQMQLLQSGTEELREGASAEGQAQYDTLLSWLEDAIAQKELEASYAQMDSLIDEARSTNGSYTGLNDVKDAAKDMTTDELERFLVKASAAKSSDWGTLPVLALGALDKIIEYLNSELEARQAQEDAQDAPTYINIGGEQAVFVGAVEADVKAVKVSGSTRNIEILADRSNAVAWSTNIDPASLEELIAMLGNAATNDVASNIKAYKVLENGELEAKAAKVTLNADGTLTASALSNGNSTYIFVLEPNPYSDVDENDWYYDAAMTMDQRLLMQGTSATTFGGGVTTSRGMIATILYRLDGEPDADLESIFTDVAAGSYYHDAILWAEENGIVTGYGGGVFGPDDPITREQLAAMLYRYARYRGYDVSVGEDTNILSYNDAFEISEYAIPAMQWACGEGIIGGRGGGILDPRGKATRAEAAVMLSRFLETEE